MNATKGEFETGFESGGQTREHALLARSLGNIVLHCFDELRSLNHFEPVCEKTNNLDSNQV